MRKQTGFTLVLVLIISAFSSVAFATNGMNFEGYGPISTGMGGASFAFDNGLAGMMNNPATLGLLNTDNRLDLAVGRLGPNVLSSYGPMGSSSAMSAMYMPALGWGQKRDKFTYGVGIFAQGGVGVEYGADSPFSMGSGDVVRSEVGVMRVMIPVTYQVTPDLIIGGTVDMVRTTMDLRMAASIGQVGAMASGCTGAGCAALGAMPSSSWARFDFSDSSAYSGAASCYGIAGKIGAIYKIIPALTIGAVYQTAARNGDMKTAAGGASMAMQGGGPADVGTVTIRDFNWPATFGAGFAWTPTASWMLVADIKKILWSNILTDFKMNYQGSGVSNVDITMPQGWENQLVLNLGSSYQVTEFFVARAGLSLSSNPIPDSNVNPLFPATTKNHYMIGAGYLLTAGHSVDGAFSFSPKVEVINSGGAAPIAISHSQANGQLMYSFQF